MSFSYIKELTAKINDALAQLEENGTLTQIIANYIGDDTKGTMPYESPADVDRSNGTLVMATNAAFPPFEYVDGNSIVGVDVDIMNKVGEKLGKKVVFKNVSFDIIVDTVAQGKATNVGAAGLSITDERLEKVNFSQVYYTANLYVIYNKII